jgi:diamine N-acetyltransferase
MQIISATILHFPIINQIAKQTWPATYGEILSDAQSKYMLDWMYQVDNLKKQSAEGHQFYLAKQEDTFIGFGSCEFNYQNANKTKLHKLYILPSAQGLGVGKLLLTHIKNLAITNKSTAITLNVNRFNKAKDFYSKLGYQIIAEEDIDIGHSYIMEDYIMELKLF